MREIRLAGLLLVFVAGVAFADEAKKDDADPEQIVAKGVRQFHERMSSVDVKVRQKEFDEVMPDEKLLVTLLGEDAKLIWPKLEPQLKKFRESLEKEVGPGGEIKQVQVIDVRKEAGQGAAKYAPALKVVPQEIPIFRVVMQVGAQTVSSSCYCVVDGRMRLVRRLETLPAAIEKLKAMAK